MRATILTLTIIALLCTPAGFAADSAAPYLGQWQLTKDGGSGAGWLEVTEDNGRLKGQLLWLGGSVRPLNSVEVEDGKLIGTWRNRKQIKNPDGSIRRAYTEVETFTMTLKDGKLFGEYGKSRDDKKSNTKPLSTFTGVAAPPKPATPDLSKVEYGDPINLLAENSLDGWKVMNEKAPNGWRVENGVLINDVEPHKRHANLQTTAEFEDFNLKLEVNIPKESNSGIYLRGIYEVQVYDSYGKAVDSHNLGAIYSRITPSVSAEKPAGEWQSLDITLVDRHVTVILNGTKIIDNVFIPGCTGGALTSDVTQPGPLYLQGDHGSVKFRNIVLTPVK